MTVTVPETLASLTVPIQGLRNYPGNPRRHAMDDLLASLRHHGQYRPLVVQTSTNYVLAGNGTLDAARTLGWDEIAVTFVNCGDDQAARIVAIDNRISDLSTYDEAALIALLQPMADLGDLLGTGYAIEDVDDLAAALAYPEPDRLPNVRQDGAHRMATVQPGDGNVDEFVERYAARATRMLVLDLAVPIYAWLIEGLDRLRRADRPTNVDVLLGLVADATGTPLPYEAPGEAV